MQGTMPGVRRRGRPRTAWIDNIKSLTGLSVEESIRMTEDRDWRKYVHGVANPRIEDENLCIHGVSFIFCLWHAHFNNFRGLCFRRYQ